MNTLDIISAAAGYLLFQQSIKSCEVVSARNGSCVIVHPKILQLQFFFFFSLSPIFHTQNYYEYPLH